MIEDMQQTETYKLNLVEGEDTFSPLPLNENAEKLEAALGGLDARVTTLEVHKIAVGKYNGTAKRQIIELGFTPRAVIANSRKPNIVYMALAVPDGFPVGNSGSITISITDGGFVADADYNLIGYTYHYIAIA